MKPVSRTSTRKGSILVVSLLILSFMLVTALTVLSSAALQQKAALSTGNSTRAFQLADSAIELVSYQLYKRNPSTLQALSDSIPGTSCSNGIVSINTSPTEGTWLVAFYSSDSTTEKVTCSQADWRSKVVRIKAQGNANDTSRAVEVSVKGPSALP